MVDAKWSGKDITTLLTLYQTYPCLWDASSKNFTNRSSKDAAFKELLQKLEERGLKTSLDTLKKKIKSIRDTYRSECYKIKKSKKSGAIGDDVYKPRMVWFSAAHFWRSGMGIQGRKTASKQVNNEDTPDEDPDEMDKECEESSPKQYEPHTRRKQQMKQHQTLSVRSKPLNIPVTKEAEQPLSLMRLIPTKREERDEYAIFGEYVAHKIRKLSDERAKAVVQHVINNALFDAEMGKYDDPLIEFCQNQYSTQQVYSSVHNPSEVQDSTTAVVDVHSLWETRQLPSGDTGATSPSDGDSKEPINE